MAQWSLCILCVVVRKMSETFCSQGNSDSQFQRRLSRNSSIFILYNLYLTSGIHLYFDRGDTHHLQNIVKPQLLQRVMEVFPEEFQDSDLIRNQYRDRILQCIDYAVQASLSVTLLRMDI